MMSNFKKLAIDYKLLIKKMLEKIEEEAINSKKNKDYHGLEYQYLKEMAFELASISNYVNINIDPYLLIEISLLKYINIDVGNSQKIDQPNVIIQEENKNINSKKDPPLVSPKISIDNEEQKKIIDIRINNCFLNAKKEFLNNIKENWSKFISTLNNNTLLNLLVDCNIVAASDTIIILTSNIEATVNLLNDNWLPLNADFYKILKLLRWFYEYSNLCPKIKTFRKRRKYSKSNKRLQSIC